MTELHIDSKSPKFDRRKVLSGAAMIAAVPFIPAQAAEYDETDDLWTAWCDSLLACRKAQIAARKAGDALPDVQWYCFPGQEDRWHTMGQIDRFADRHMSASIREQFRRDAKAGLAPILEEIKRAEKRTHRREKFERWNELAVENDKLGKAILKSKSNTPVAKMRKLFIATVFYAVDDEAEKVLSAGKVKAALKATVTV